LPIRPSDEQFAHTLEGTGCDSWELLSTHLEAVAHDTAEMAAAFGAYSWGEIIGRCHDLGKRSSEFQAYLHRAGTAAAADASSEEEGSAGRRVDHSTFGARYLNESLPAPAGQLLAFVIAGHHTGLADWETTLEAGQRSTLRYKLEAANYTIPFVSKPELTLPALKMPLRPEQNLQAFQCAFFTRMLFSCLIDADRTCTERFCDAAAASLREQARSSRPTLADLRHQLDQSLLEMSASSLPTAVNLQRRYVLDACRKAAELEPGFFSLHVPTGGGKTLASFAFALDHALAPGRQLRRVVMAIPFTSIIEQTADVYRKALGPLAAEALIEHHSNLQPTRDTRSNQLGTENWDAPLIVTTNAQFFESLFASKTTPCRKLHNLVGSIIILDEAQTIPVDLLRPALAALRELVLNYHCSIVLCTATQPALERRADFDLGLERVRPIIPDAKALFQALRRVEVRQLGKVTDSELIDRVAAEPSALCIVNTRRHASRLYDLVAGRCEEGSCFHLSTWMCGDHRREVLAAVRLRLKHNQPCYLVSTQLVEAGVDVDFPTVFRAGAGFDSIAQAAGRCNREGKAKVGYTYVFESEQAPPPGFLRDAASVGKELLHRFIDPLAPEAIEAYFRQFYWGQKARWDKYGVMQLMSLDRQRGHVNIQFREIAAAFVLIRDEEVSVLIPRPGEGEWMWDRLSLNKVPYVPQRELQPYLVSVRKPAVQQMLKAGFVQEHESGVWLLLNRSLYSASKGLNPEATTLDESLWAPNLA